MRRIAAEDNGVVVILRGDEGPREIVESLQSLGSGARKAPGPVLRTYGIGAQILGDLGITRMRVLSRYTHLQGLAAFGLTITEYVHTGAVEAIEESNK
jgi:3,4-dihydroxy 2-butanone 4-phosphate synthase/GTP cyclohydrolase II